MTKPTWEQIEVFKRDVLEVYKKHNMCLVPYHIQYDEFDSDEGLEVSSMSSGNWYTEQASPASGFVRKS